MFKKPAFLLIFLLIFSGCAPKNNQVPQAPLEMKGIQAFDEPITKEDRILILAPHPDDEAIGCAGVIQKAVEAGAQVKVVYLTNGDHNQLAFIVFEKRITLKQAEFIHMGQVRRKESIEAMKLLGLKEEDLVFLGYPDFGTFAIFSQYWQTSKPFKSFLTRISAVPYKENLSFDAPYVGESILSDLKSVLLKYKPNKIFVSHPADVNVDHKSLYLFLQVALADLKKDIPPPKIYSYLIHCVGWPLPRHYHPELNLLPPAKFLNTQINWRGFALTKEQLSKKHEAVLRYRSQTRSSAFYLLSFVRKNELFGDYPEVQLDRQQPLGEKPISFSGSSTMFVNRETLALEDEQSYNEDKKGEVSYAVIDGSLLIRVEKPKESNDRLSLMFYLFGYSYNTPFSQMPKIRIITKHHKLKILDGKKIVKTEEASLELTPETLILKVPLQILGNPDFILTSIKTYKRFLPMDAIGFRKIVIK